LSNIKPIDALRGTLIQMKPQLEVALPPHVSADKFIRTTVTAVQNNQKLLSCERNSLLSSFLKCASDGLLPDGREAAIVPFGKEAVYMDMLAGVLKKIRNSGELKSLDADVVHRNDQFDHWKDERGPHFKHVPLYGSERGDKYLAYAQAITKDGGVYLEVMDEEQLNKVRAASKQKDGAIWKNWEEEMWKKTVIRRLSKRLPMSTDLIGGATEEEATMEAEAETVVTHEEKTVTPTEPDTPSRTKELMKDKRAPGDLSGLPNEAPI